MCALRASGTCRRGWRDQCPIKSVSEDYQDIAGNFFKKCSAFKNEKRSYRWSCMSRRIPQKPSVHGGSIVNFLVLFLATATGLFAQQQSQLSALKWTEPVPAQVVGQIPPGWQIVELKDQKITH